jgi:hypothetical protein
MEDSSSFVICVEFSRLVQRIDRDGIDLGKNLTHSLSPAGKGEGGGSDPPAYRQGGDHAGQTVCSGNAPYRKGKTI